MNSMFWLFFVFCFENTGSFLYFLIFRCKVEYGMLHFIEWYTSFRKWNGVKNKGIASIDLALNIEYIHLCNAMDLVGSIHSLFRRMSNGIMAIDHNNTKNRTNSIVIVSSDEINHGLPADHEFLVNASIQRRFLDVCFVISFQIDSGFLFVHCTGTPNLFI